MSTYDKKREENGIVELTFDQLDLSVFTEGKGKTSKRYRFSRFMAAKYFLGYALDTWLIIQIIQFGQTGLAVTWGLSMALSIAFLYFEIKKAKKIIAENKVNPNFVNEEAYRYQTVKSYARYCLMREIMAATTSADRRLFRCYFALRRAPRLLLVDLTQLIVTTVLVVTVTGDAQSIISLVLKYISCVSAFINLLYVLIIYPFVKCGASGSISEKAKYRIDMRLNQMLMVTNSSFAKMPQKELKQAAKDAGLKTGGGIAKLRVRMAEHEGATALGNLKTIPGTEAASVDTGSVVVQIDDADGDAKPE